MRTILLAGLLLLLGCSDNSQLYHNTHLNFSLQLPADVQWREAYMGSALVIEPRPDSALSGELRYISIDVNEAQSETSNLNDYSEFRLRQLQRFASRSDIQQRGTLNLAGHPAQRLLASVQFGPQESELLLYYLLVNGRGYTITAAFSPTRGDKTVQRVESLLASLNLAPR